LKLATIDAGEALPAFCGRTGNKRLPFTESAGGR
jgi:hypothetical protein